MCIRDRAGDEPVGCGQRQAGQGAGAARQSLGSADARPHGCLLYTSDAADERSSVDLGGRRIIKKKKSNEDEGGTRRCEQKEQVADIRERTAKQQKERGELKGGSK